jgi:hypothetical protein
MFNDSLVMAPHFTTNQEEMNVIVVTAGAVD